MAPLFTEQWSHAPLLDEKQQNAASHETHVGPTHQKQLFLGYQTLINVAAGEPRPQPRSQTAPNVMKISQLSLGGAGLKQG